MLKSFSLFLLVFFASVNSHAQLGRSLQACWVHLDKPFYVVDDVVGYQLYLPPEFNGIDASIQTILFDADGQALWYSYQQNQRTSSMSGALMLHNKLSTNWYYLSFRAWDENRKTERVLLQVPLAIYNDQETIMPSLVSQQEPARLKDPVVVDNKELNLSLTISPEKPRPGEEVKLTIKATNRRGKPVQADLSVSINDWSQLSTSLAMGMDNLHAGDSLRVITPGFLSSGFYWQGILLDKENQVLPNMQMLAHNANEMTTLITNDRGRFLFKQDNRSTNYNLAFNLLDDSPVNVQFMPQRGRLVMGKLFYTPAAFRYLENNRQRRKISDLLAPAAQKQLATQQNEVSIHTGRFLLEGFNDQQSNSWVDDPITPIPLRPSWMWQSGLKTNTQGELSFTFLQASEHASFRVDVTGQDSEGHRTRASMLYRVE